MTPYQIHCRVRRHAMGLLRLRILTAHDLAVLAAMLDHACPRGALAFSTTYDWLQKVTGLCRQTIADAIRRLDACGLVRRFRTGRVVRGRWRQYPNRYFVSLSESAQQTDTPRTKNQNPAWVARMTERRRVQQEERRIEGSGEDWPPPALRSRVAQLVALGFA